MQIFKPQLTLHSEPDGEFTLDAMTLTPSSCYSAGRAVLEPPSNVRLIAEAFPVLLQVRARSGPCAMFVRPVRHRLRNLKLGAQHGKTTVSAFVMLDGRVVGSSSIAVPACGPPLPNKNPVTVDTTDFYAWVNRMPPGPASLHVTGTVVLPSPGYDATLRLSDRPGPDPSELALDLVVKKKPGMWPQVLTPVSVRFDQETYSGAYKSVLVREPDGDKLQIDLEEVF